MPRLGLYLDEATPDVAGDACAGLGAAYLQARVDLRRADCRAQCGRALQMAQACGCPLQLDVVIAGLTPADEIAALADWSAEMRGTLDNLFVIPARDLSGRPPGAEVDGGASDAVILDAARGLFPGLKLVGGAAAGFAELNRKRPPPGIDVIAHSTQAVVHAADDASVMETFEALAAMIATTRSFAGGVPYRIGPVTIGMPSSASGAPPIETAGERRVAMGSRDPRQRGLFGAAFLVGYVAGASGVDALTLGAAAGDCGLLETSGAWRPGAAAFKALAGLSGAPRLHIGHSAPSRLAAIAAVGPDGPALCLANLGSEPVDVRLDGPAVGAIRLLDAARLSRATPDQVRPDAVHSRMVSLDSYAVACLS